MAGGQLLTVGFNRRFAEGLSHLRREFDGIRPLTVQYRFAVPDVPESSWIQRDSVGGGRIIGEACHAIDACTAIVGAPPVRVFAESAGTAGTLARSDDRVFITLRHGDGSVSSVAYLAGGDRAMPAERIEVSGGGKSAVLDHWTDLTVWSDGSQRRRRLPTGKGHAELLQAFVTTCRSGGEWPIPWSHVRAGSLAAILAEQSTREGVAFEVDLA
jgi:predicted dehydrogenase